MSKHIDPFKDWTPKQINSFLQNEVEARQEYFDEYDKKQEKNSPFNLMTKDQERAFFNADSDTNKHGKREIEKERRVNSMKQEG